MLKKIGSCIIALCLCAFTIMMNVGTVSAASVKSSGNQTVAEGSTISITFQVSSDAVTSGSIDITCSSSLEIVSGKFNLSGTTLAQFDMSTKKGAFAFTSAKKLSGNYFTVVLKGKTIDKNAWVKAVVTLKNGAKDVSGGNTTKAIKVICKSHSYSAYSTTDPTCTKAGSKSRTCSVCGTVDAQTIAALGHDTSGLTITKQPTCTETGLATGTCPRCKTSATAVVPANGHDYGSWKNISASTCTVAGTDARNCKVCNAQETKETELAKHQLGENVTVLQEATLTSYGIVEGVCKVCDQTVRIESDCTMKDSATGAVITCNEGVFPQGTEIKIEQVADTTKYADVLAKSGELGSKITIYDLSAILNGANIQPNGTLTVTLEVPEGYSEKVCFVYLNENGEVEVMGSTYENGKLTATLSHFSVYAMVDLTAPEAIDNTNPMFMYTTIALGVTTLLFFVLYITKKPKQFER